MFWNIKNNITLSVLKVCFIGSTIIYTPGQGGNAGPFGNVTGFGSGTTSSPYTFFSEFEFTSGQVSLFNLPSTTDTIACISMVDNAIDMDFGSEINFSNPENFLSLPQFPFPVVASNDPSNDLGNESTSKAVNLTSLSILLGFIGVMSFNS